MIYDSLIYFHKYLPIHPLFKVVLNFINNNNLSDINVGKIDIDQGVYALIVEYTTNDIESRFIECHTQYIDIQIVVAGIEQIGICNKKECKIIGTYNEENDYEKLEGKIDLITLKNGYFTVFYPQDGHVVGLKIRNKEDVVKKVVFKVPV
ncbi:MAG: YhcH/YjgK/YiaL family protein [Proteobacteria bacterium]|nr:YhcH/YjgK/YiaL family protein [Pseudomonadota bacterium]